MVDTNGEQWSVDSFRVVILVINTLLLMDIIRVMLFKMKQRGPTKQTKLVETHISGNVTNSQKSILGWHFEQPYF